MPALSKAQFRFMERVANGSIKSSSLSPEKAAEFVQGQSPGDLPEHVRPKRKGKKSKRHPWAKGAKELFKR